MHSVAAGCLQRNDWICGEYLSSRRGELLDALVQHLELTAISVLIGIVVAVPLAVLARAFHLSPLILGLSTGVYTIPSIALFAFFIPYTGISATTVVLSLVLYSLVVLVRNMIAGLNGVSEEVKEAARGMGYGPGRLLLTVELPLAMPAFLAGVRVATVSTVALTTVGGIIGYGGLGNLIFAGLSTSFKSQVLSAAVLCVVLAIAADVGLQLAQRVLVPWQRGTR